MVSFQPTVSQPSQVNPPTQSFTQGPVKFGSSESIDRIELKNKGNGPIDVEAIKRELTTYRELPDEARVIVSDTENKLGKLVDGLNLTPKEVLSLFANHGVKVLSPSEAYGHPYKAQAAPLVALAMLTTWPDLGNINYDTPRNTTEIKKHSPELMKLIDPNTTNEARNEALAALEGDFSVYGYDQPTVDLLKAVVNRVNENNNAYKSWLED